MPKCVLMVLISRMTEPLHDPLLDPPGPVLLTVGGVIPMLELSGMAELKGLPSTPSTINVYEEAKLVKACDEEKGAVKE